MKNNKKNSNKRKLIYQLGIILIAIGAIIFLSTFIIGFINFGEFDTFDNFKQRAKNQMFRTFSGIFLILIGSILSFLGRRRIAGSGFILETIKIKCQSCNHLNDEHDKFCSGCGKKI